MAKKSKTEPCCGGISVSDDKYSEWRVESAYRALKEAEEFKKDDKMMKLVGKLLDKEAKTITSLDELREKLNVKKSEEDDE